MNKIERNGQGCDFSGNHILEIKYEIFLDTVLNDYRFVKMALITF